MRLGGSKGVISHLAKALNLSEMINKLLLWLSFSFIMRCRFLEMRIIVVTEFLLIQFIRVHWWSYRVLKFIGCHGCRTVLSLVCRSSVLDHGLHGHFRSLVSWVVDVELLS